MSSKRKARADLVDRRLICLLCDHRHTKRVVCDSCECFGNYAKRPCAFCEHLHIEKDPCPRLDCDCPGSLKWCDWVVVELALDGKHDQIGRRMTWAERRAIVHRMKDKGLDVESVSRLTKLNAESSRQLLAEVGHGIEPSNPAQRRLAI